MDVDLLDRLMNLVGELVLARNQIVQYAGQGQDATFNTTTQHLNQLTSELQEGVMKTRMQPIGNIWNKFPRVVRDLSLACGKQVRLEMEGKETELDKTLIEAIKDPLTHIVRNSALVYYFPFWVSNEYALEKGVWSELRITLPDTSLDVAILLDTFLGKLISYGTRDLYSNSAKPLQPIIPFPCCARQTLE